MRSITGIFGAALALVLAATPASAVTYDYYLTSWNTTELNSAGDQIHVEINGNTVTFTWVDGNSLDPSAINIDEIAYAPSVGTSAGTGTATGYTTTDPCGNQNDPLCTEDGFGSHVWIGEVKDDNPNAGSRQTVVVLTFANALPSGLDLALHSFAVHVQYSNNCSGWVDGATDPNSASSCTPVPEPVTVFLGGTGLLIMGYFARKRLFSMGRILAA